MIATDKGGVGLLGLIIALIAVGLAVANGDDVIGISGGTTYNNATYAGGNWTIDFNSSNWYPDSRQFNTLYWNNQSKPMIVDITIGNVTADYYKNYTLKVNTSTPKKYKTASEGYINIYYYVPQYSNYNITSIGSSALDTEITWLEHNLTFTPSIVNNYYNTTGGGGISFNGSAVDMNRSLLYNGTFNSTAYTVTTNTTATAANVTLRYYSNHSLIWSEE